MFYTSLANYLADAAAYNSTIFINTPVTADSKGNVFFRFAGPGTTPLRFTSSAKRLCPVDSNGNGTYVLAGTAANNPSVDSHAVQLPLSVATKARFTSWRSPTRQDTVVRALDSTTLAMTHRVFLRDPRNKATARQFPTSARPPPPSLLIMMSILGSSAIRPMVHGDFSCASAVISRSKNPLAGFGWDYTAAIVPASMVPSYQGTCPRT